MKLSWKIFFSSFLVIIFTFSVGGFFLISDAFQSSLNRETTAALHENKVLYHYFQILSPSVSMTNKSSVEAAVSGFVNKNRIIRIYDKNSKLIYKSSDIGFTGQTPAYNEDNTDNDKLNYSIITYQGKYYIYSYTGVNNGANKLYFESFHDISSLYGDRETMFSKFRFLMLFMIGFNGLIVFLITVWTLLPIKKLSGTAKQIAGGEYGQRVFVKSKDEIGILADDFNKMADKLELKINDLEDAKIRQENFIGSFAHELKTPLTSIIGYADMLRSKKMAEENKILAADYIFAEGKRLEKISLKLLELFALKNRSFENRNINLKALFKSISYIMHPIFLNTNIKFILNTENVEIAAEEDLLKILIINLLDNAKKSITNEGKIYLSGKRINKNEITLTVTDTGKGIPAHEIDKITEPFYMTDKARTGNGAGLGLFICSEIVKMYHGRIQFESLPGKGTKATVILGG